jgi:hypothetical protein
MLLFLYVNSYINIVMMMSKNSYVHSYKINSYVNSYTNIVMIMAKMIFFFFFESYINIVIFYSYIIIVMMMCTMNLGNFFLSIMCYLII